MTFSQRMEQRQNNLAEYFNRFGHHYSTYGYFMLDTKKDDELLSQCLAENKPMTEVLDKETLNLIKKAAHGGFFEQEK